MNKIDPTVRRETGFIALFVLAGSMLMQGVCIVAGWWSLQVRLGNLLGGVTAVGNFLLMGLTVQKAVTQEEKQAKNTVRLSMSGRLMLQGLILVVAAVLPGVFNIYTTAIPLLLPRIGVTLRGYTLKSASVPAANTTADNEDDEDDED